MINLIGSIIGAIGASVYVGFLAYKVGKIALIGVVVIALCLMIYAFYEDLRRDNAIARARKENSPSS